MIYFDNAATSGVKPESVKKAVMRALSEFSVNAGRGGYARSLKAAEEIYMCRKKIKEMFCCDDESQVVFCPSCTYAVNCVLKGCLGKGDGAVISSIEHNAAARPAFALKTSGIDVETAEVIFGDDDATVRSFEKKITDNTRLVFTVHASNVNGHVMPIAQIGELCRKKGVLFGVDAAQTAGVLPIDMEKMNIDFLCIAPHKGLMAPMGTGILIARKPIKNTLIEGGTGTLSAELSQPADMPERLESGTVNLPGIFGISAGIDYVNSVGINKIYDREMHIHDMLYDGLSNVSGIRIYSPDPHKFPSVPVLSVNKAGVKSETVAAYLGQRGVEVRAGLHCSPLAHSRLGTLDTGTVRFSSGFNNTEKDVLTVIGLFKNM